MSPRFFLLLPLGLCACMVDTSLPAPRVVPMEVALAGAQTGPLNAMPHLGAGGAALPTAAPRPLQAYQATLPAQAPIVVPPVASPTVAPYGAQMAHDQAKANMEAKATAAATLRVLGR